MKVRIIYTSKIDQSGQSLEDVLNWPDLATLEEVKPHVTIYLDNKYGAGNYELISVEEAIQ